MADQSTLPVSPLPPGAPMPPPIGDNPAVTTTEGIPPASQPPPQPNWLVRQAMLQSEYVSGGGYPYLSRFIRSLPHYIDDTTRDFGDDLYEQMLNDSQVSSAIRLLKEATLSSGVRLEPAVEPLGDEDEEHEETPVGPDGAMPPVPSPTDPDKEKKKADAKLAQEICDFCDENLRHLDRPFSETLYELLDALALGNRVAEKVFEIKPDEDGVPRMRLKSLKVKPRKSTAFVLDPYNNLIGLLGMIPGQAYPVMTGSVVSDPAQIPNLIHPEKFVIFTWASKNNDPRGNALDPETPIPTPNGWRKMDDLQPGDQVFDEKGRIRYVTARKDWDDRPCYRLKFRDGSSIIADDNHLWHTYLLWERTAKAPGKVRNTAEIVRTLRNSDGLANHGILRCEALQYPEQILPVHPYYLGLWLGDGDSNSASIATNAWDVEETAEYIRECGYSTKIYQNGKSDCNGRQIRTSGQGKWDSEGPAVGLRLLGVRNNKHIPKNYLRGSIQQRLDLLRGLMDSDGYVDRDGRCEFANTNPDLVRGVAELVQSLGVNARIRRRRNACPEKNTQEVNSVYFSPPWSPFRLKRKAARTLNERAQKHHYIVDAERVTNRRTVCIEVDSPSHLFLAGESMIPTHNSLLRVVYNPWWLKMQTWTEMAKYLVKFATPSLIGYTAPGAQPMPPTDSLGNIIPGMPLITPEQAMLNALLSFTNGSAVVFPNGAKVDPLNMMGDGSVYRNAIGMFDDQITKGILCQTLATNEGSNMSRAAASTHQDVIDIVVLHIKSLLSATIYRDILEDIVRYNWGDDIARRLTPKPHLNQTMQHNWAQDAASIASLTTSGYLDFSQFRELDARLGLPMRSADAKPPAPKGGAPGGGPPGAAPAGADQGQQDQGGAAPDPLGSLAPPAPEEDWLGPEEPVPGTPPEGMPTNGKPVNGKPKPGTPIRGTVTMSRPAMLNGKKKKDWRDRAAIY